MLNNKTILITDGGTGSLGKKATEVIYENTGQEN